MPVTIVTTVGSASANSYVSLAEAEVFAAELLPRPDGWFSSSPDEKNRALIMARKKLDAERFRGDRVNDVQGLEWPRYPVQLLGVWGYYETTVVPAPVKEAQARLAIFWAEQAKKGVDPFASSNIAGLSSLSLGAEASMSFEPGASSVRSGDRFMVMIRQILGPLVYATGSRVLRG